MRSRAFPKVTLLAVAVLLLWLKTYVAYQTSFDIPIENWKQELILLINPLSFILFILGLSMFFQGAGRNRYMYIVSWIVTGVLFANIVYYRFFNDFITLPVLFQTSNMGDLGSSVNELIMWTDLLYFIDLLVIGWILWKKPQVFHNRPVTKMARRAYFLVVVAIAFFNLGLAETERPELLTRTFDREILVKNIGTYNYLVYDAYLQSKSSAQRAFADGSELDSIENYVSAEYKEPNEDMFGVAKGKNVILISLESTQSFVFGEKINGEEITPFLNDFMEESLNFTNFYSQTGQGKTSDSEFLLDNSLYPSSRGAVFFTNALNEYRATPEVLGENGYYTATLHANNKSFWNRDVMYNTLGYDRFYSLTDYEVTEENSVGWGLKDIPFFEQSIQYLKEMKQPFYTKFITLTNHFPFELDEEDRMIDEYDSNSETLNRYFPTIRYEDEAVKTFIQQLKDEGLYEDSIIVIYADHYGISENHNEAMGQFLGKEVTPFVSTQLQQVPLMIRIPGMEGKQIDTVGGQIDLRPTLLHLLGIDTKDDIQFGADLFAEDRLDFAVLRDGSFITDKYLYTSGICYDKATEEPVEDAAVCDPYIEKAEKELSYSDAVVSGDLLRFYEEDRQGDSNTDAAE
ncbi:LTA synthase family protein [Bacillus fonticola]|uniref:LTA synthase family protein n=1 Tax=Bacillus fonticola TaxID=2728853 RepID=UPI001472F297|nr:LTA synthase family protein [Bacillus fonticola]